MSGLILQHESPQAVATVEGTGNVKDNGSTGNEHNAGLLVQQTNEPTGNRQSHEDLLVAAFQSSDGVIADDLPYEEVAQESLIHPPDFKPFFTLVNDTETGEYHHPTVHYLFSDDDPDILTSAALGTLDEANEGRSTQRLPDGSDERFIIVDIAASGKTVASAFSLSSEWQGLTAIIKEAPSWGGDASSADRGLMLELSGRQNPFRDEVVRRRGHPDDMDDLVSLYSARLRQLDDVLRR